MPNRTRFLFLAGVAMIAQVCALASPILPNIWYEFSFDNGSPDPANNVPATACSAALGCPINPPFDIVWANDPAWTYTAPPQGSIFTVTDVAVAGDSFNVFDFGTRILATPSAAASGYVCGTTDTDYIDPAVCVNDPNLSHGQVFLAPGPHSLTIDARDSPFGGGIGDFMVTDVPESPTIVLLALALAWSVKMQIHRIKRQIHLHDITDTDPYSIP